MSRFSPPPGEAGDNPPTVGLPSPLAESELRTAARLRALSAVLAGAGHDLRAPLNAMVLHLELLRQSLAGASGPSDMKRRRDAWLAAIDDGTQRLRRLLDRLLAEAAPPRDEGGRFDLCELVREGAGLVAPQARRQRVEVTLDLAAPLVVEGPRDWLKQALLNLLFDALEAMPEGGRLAIAGESQDGGARLRIGGTAPREEGAGTEERPAAYGRGDAGLGLRLARSVLAAHAGAAETYGDGSAGPAFELRFPLSQES